MSCDQSPLMSPLDDVTRQEIEHYLQHNSYGVNLKHVRWLRLLLLTEQFWREKVQQNKTGIDWQSRQNRA